MAITLDGSNGIRLPSLASDPAGTEQGRIYYNTTNGAPRVYTSIGWATFGAALGTSANPISTIAEAQANNIPEGLWYFKNSNSTIQQLYYDPADGGWILVSSNDARSSVIPAGSGRNDLAYTLHRNGTMGHLGTPDPNSDYIIGDWYSSFSFSRARLLSWGWGSTNGTYSFTNLGTYGNVQWNVTSRDTVTTLANVSFSGNSSIYSNSGYWCIDGVYKDYVNGGFAANPNQTTIGAVGVAAPDGDPDSGCYWGHGTSEGNYEGWYNSSGSAADCQGYTTWLR
jgi:hypothetical protein